MKTTFRKTKYFMRNFIFFVFLFLNFKAVSQNITCPENKQVDVLIDKAIEFNKAGESEKTIKVLQEAISLSRLADCQLAELICYKNLMLQYAQIYDYKKALEISKKAEKIALELKNYSNLSTLYTTRATLYDNLGLYDESIKQYETALTYAERIEKGYLKLYSIGFIYYNLAPYYQDTSLEKSIDYLEKSKIEIEKIKDNNDEISLNKKKNLLVSINTNLGIFYFMNSNPNRNLQLSESYFSAALKDAEIDNYQIDTDSKISLFEALLEFYNGKKEYNKAVKYGERLLELEKSYSMPYERRVGYMVLAKAYLGLEKSEISQKYLDLFSKLNDSINKIEKEAVEESIKQIVKKNEKNYSEKLRTIIIGVSISILAFLIIGMLIWKQKKRRLHKTYEKIIETLKVNLAESQKTLILKEADEEDNIQKTLNMSEEKAKALLIKLDKFERNNQFTKQEVSFSYLSNYLRTNSKYLNEILKIYKDKTFSQYINDLRIDYITKHLYEEPKSREYKISYLAEICGFSSREVFAVAFKKKMGISPSYFIENLRKEKN